MPPLTNRFIQKADLTSEIGEWTHNEWLCRPDLVAAEKLMMVRATMPPFHSHPFHLHPHREEIIYVLSGKAEQWVGEEVRILEPGDIAHIPAGMVHATYNPFDTPLVFQAILSPAKLPDDLAAAVDPLDVSNEVPWINLREGRVSCRLLDPA